MLHEKENIMNLRPASWAVSDVSPLLHRGARGDLNDRQIPLLSPFFKGGS